MKIFNVGLIGYGLSGRYLQAPFFNVHSGFNLHSIVTKNNNPKIDFPDVRHVINYKELLDNDEVDLISICSPNPTHYLIAKECLEANKNILVEKPLVGTLAEALELYTLAENKGLQIFVYQNRRFDSDFLTLQKFINNDRLGRIVSLDINYHRYKPELNPKKWKEVYDFSNGIMYDLGSHILDQAIALFGRPINWYGQTFTQRVGSDIDDSFMIWLNYQDVKVCLRSSMLVAIDQPRYILIGTNGMALKCGIDQQEDHLKAGISILDDSFGVEDSINELTFSDGVNTEKVKTEKGNWMNFYDGMYKVLENKSSFEITKDQILLQLEILESIKSSS